MDGILCGEPTPTSYCDTHLPLINQAKHHKAYSTTRWKRLAKRVIAKHRARHGDLCPGYQVPPHLDSRLSADHITPLVLGGAMWDTDNLGVLCVACNARKDAATRAVEGGGSP